MKIGILGTRGIPNHYGGFEQFAEYVSLGLTQRGHEVSVYNSNLHPFQESIWKGINIIHCKDYEHKIGTSGQFVYDLNCILDARKRDFDILLQLGYTSSSIWGWLLPKKQIVVTNMDGLEWKRTKFSNKVKYFLKHAEKWGVTTSDYLVADSIGIQSYLKEKYDVESDYIAYGAEVFDHSDVNILKEFNLEERGYHMLIARMEPENNVELILDGFQKYNKGKKFLVIGNVTNQFGKYLVNKFKANENILFLGGIYDLNKLNNLRYFSDLYFHGHSVGGTNPSLLEAMASHALIAAHDNIFNRSILNDSAYYFSRIEDFERIFEASRQLDRKGFVSLNLKKIRTDFSWEHIVDRYEGLFIKLLNRKS